MILDVFQIKQINLLIFKNITMLENLEKYQIENQEQVLGGKLEPHNPECFDSQTS